MKIQLIRNATLVVQYAGKKFLIDPFLGEKGIYPPFPNSLRQDQNNPLVSLPISVDNIISNLDAVIVTHLHLDHWDDTAKEVLPKDIKMFVQNEEDATEVRNSGFQNVEVLQENSAFGDIQLVKTKGEHGRGEILQLAGHVCGVVFKHPSEKTLYIAGDTVWYEAVQEAIDKHKPEIIVVNGGDNQFLQGGSLVMGKEDIYNVYTAAPEAKIISVHMEAVNHWTLSREELKSYTNERGISSNVLIPNDGESFAF
ncbi:MULTISPECIES: MBL fold metallo-hydrolase [unclassified Paenibacillus]|uniref:MBL fold metallo-hydrolase n=1 Tax=unclassified Paenibacillus TaxID=185978 RepID=UPI0027835529|nr:MULTISPECIES: MBL fold metallo-hydrolase [unclassified Paenibacillus]MDQ0902389.1 L-ascorbate metabolism protein UlaG (beta-lactamase superfamily) [Paenibacillus sp. V4I7]MDQ0919102.1 L-ascorbate metabolism protein UlaG (beta-lactamase superfamily) [Paenibacillus sp. V4I5]